MLNRIISSVLAVACIALAIMLWRSGGSAAPAALPATQVGFAPNVGPVDEEHVLLDRPLGDMRFDEAALDEVIEALSERAKVTLYVRWQSLEGAGIDRTAPVTMHLRNASLGQALNVLENYVGSDTAQLAHVADDGVVTISTADDRAKLTTTEIYDIRDLLDEMVATDAAWTAKTGIADSTAHTYGQAVEFLMLQISTIDPESWRVAGGTIATYYEFAGLLFITQTSERQREIRQLLERIRNSLHHGTYRK